MVCSTPALTNAVKQCLGVGPVWVAAMSPFLHLIVETMYVVHTSDVCGAFLLICPPVLHVRKEGELEANPIEDVWARIWNT